MPSPSQNSELDYEDRHVHKVYQDIASHFSSTRYKAWPVVDDFLRALPAGSIGLDIGCGNGKYLGVRHDVFIVGSDRSSELVQIARQHEPHEAVVGDILNLPHSHGMFDFAISIAVVHHLSTKERRVQAIREILATLKPASTTCGKQRNGAEALIFVWALEQKGSRRGWDKGGEQDVLVPWVLKDDVKSKATSEATKSATTAPTTYQRYYHLYHEGELQEDVVAAGGVVVRSGYDRDNWWAVLSRKAAG